MQQLITIPRLPRPGHGEAEVVIDCPQFSSEASEAMITWIKQSPRGSAIRVLLPSLSYSPTARRITGELLSLGCVVTCRRSARNNAEISSSSL